MVIDPVFWKDRKVFITGHTGFKGSWISLWLNQLNAKVTGYALEPATDPAIFDIAQVKEVLENHIVGDIKDISSLTKAIQASKPEIVIHMAAQSLVRESYEDPVGTYNTNIMGTVNLLEAARHTSSVKAVLNITSDKCYENHERSMSYSENDSMGGHDPYSSSKGCAELVSTAYRSSFLKEAGIALATGRAGNVIGGGDWAKDRLVPDAIRNFMHNKTLLVRNPKAIRPWQHVLEPLSGYLVLCQHLINYPNCYDQGWNFGPNDKHTQPVSILADIMAKSWGEVAHWELDEGTHSHEANLLKLDCSKAKKLLKWKSIWRLERALDETVQWYKSYHNQNDMREFTLRQIETYQQEQMKV